MLDDLGLFSQGKKYSLLYIKLSYLNNIEIVYTDIENEENNDFITIKTFRINAVLLNVVFIKESWKSITKILCSTTVFIDNNQKCFLSSKSAYYYDFWRSCDTEDCSNDAENTALITEINYSLTHIHIENCYFILQ